MTSRFLLFVSGGRPPKALVGAAKRKAKIPRIVKLKPLETAIKEAPSEEDNDANFDDNNDTADNSENNEDENDDDDDDDDDEYNDNDDDDGDDMKKKSEGSGEEKGTSSETSHQPAIFRYESLYVTLSVLYWVILAVMMEMNGPLDIILFILVYKEIQTLHNPYYYQTFCGKRYIIY
jgi:hypothetical protein